jgi:site-specific DNA recombinase
VTVDTSTPTPARRTAAIYARISETVERRDKVADQIAQCERLAERRGYEIVRVYKDDGISALGGKERPGFDALLDGIVAHDFDVVLATEEERFARNLRDKTDLQAACMETGVVWETDRDGFVDPSTESGEFFSTMRAAMGRMESRRKSARQRSANADRAAAGRPNPGRRRFGYESDGIHPRPDEAAVVRRMFAHILEGRSLRSLSQALTAEGVDPSPGKDWSPRRVRDIITNPHYSGRVRHLGVITPSDVVIPIVSEEDAASARALLADPGRKVTPGNQRRHLLSGLVHCGVCGDALVYRNTYLCGDNPGHISITKRILETHVRDEVAAALITGGPALFASADGATIFALIESLSANRTAVSSTIEDRDEGFLPPDMARTRLALLKAERAQIEASLERARNEKGAGAALLDIARRLITEPVVDMSEFTSAKAHVLAEFDKLELSQQRDIVAGLLYVEVPKGRDPRRAHILHKLATHLNPDEPVAEQD